MMEQPTVLKIILKGDLPEEAKSPEYVRDFVEYSFKQDGLKAQVAIATENEPIVPVTHRQGGHLYAWCGMCSKDLRTGPSSRNRDCYCGRCGRKIKWSA